MDYVHVMLCLSMNLDSGRAILTFRDLFLNEFKRRSIAVKHWTIYLYTRNVDFYQK